MYYEYFGLDQAPFKITPNTEFFYTGGNRGAILDALLYAIIHGEGIVKVDVPGEHRDPYVVAGNPSVRRPIVITECAPR